jgi:hypothetical protein
MVSSGLVIVFCPEVRVRQEHHHVSIVMGEATVPICVFEPPSAEIRNPVTIAAVNPCLRRHSRGDCKRHRQRHQANGNARKSDRRRIFQRYIREEG